jgi:hypothetical protein
MMIKYLRKKRASNLPLELDEFFLMGGGVVFSGTEPGKIIFASH